MIYYDSKTSVLSSVTLSGSPADGLDIVKKTFQSLASVGAYIINTYREVTGTQILDIYVKHPILGLQQE